MKLPTKKYPAFTLMEMLVVMSIFSILIAVAFSAFSGFRDTIALSQDVLDIQQTIRLAQRSALFLERDQDERWVFGIGIDLTQTVNDGSYRVFKWCSPYYDFGDKRTRAPIPNYDVDVDLGVFNGNLGLIQPYGQTECSLNEAESEIIKIGGAIDPRISSNFRRIFPDSNNADGDLGGVPVYILFESVSGRAFFYDVNGMVLNYNSDGEIVTNPIGFEMYIESERTKIRKVITVSNISGKMKVVTEKL